MARSVMKTYQGKDHVKGTGMWDAIVCEDVKTRTCGEGDLPLSHMILGHSVTRPSKAYVLVAGHADQLTAS